MAFQLSPGVLVTEKDLTNIVPAVATSNGGFAGAFVWGPVLDPTTISSENQLVARFGRPTDTNAASFFTAANFLSYSNNLLLVRADVDGALNATSDGSGLKINNPNDYAEQYDQGGGSVGEFAAKYPGALGNSVAVHMVDAASWEVSVTAGAIITGRTYTIITAGTTDFTEIGAANNNVGTKFVATGTGEGTGTADELWIYASEFDSAPSTSPYASNVGGSNDEVHIIVIDRLGAWTGVIGGIIEKFAYASKAGDARRSDGTNNFYRDVVNTNSKFIWWMDHPTAGTNWGDSSQSTVYASLSAPIASELDGGVDSMNATDSDLQEAYSIFINAELYDIQLVPTGHVSALTAKWVIDNVAEVRKDCVVFVSPVTSENEIIRGADAVEDIITYRTSSSFNVSSSYAVLDSGHKYQYDRYNDVYRWIPLNGDIAGLCARTDNTNDPWWSPGGLNRGQIKNVVKLAVNPDKTDRDNLYKNGINPVVSFPGQGIVLFGDKTLLAKPSAFDRINVRRLFIVLEKAIATAAKYQLFEFNDSFTRAQFRSLVEPFLRDVQGRRGVIDFRVICDDTNNTGEVIDRNEFIADIFIKPARSINFITLNFIAARTGISFDEIGA